MLTREEVERGINDADWLLANVEFKTLDELLVMQQLVHYVNLERTMLYANPGGKEWLDLDSRRRMQTADSSYDRGRKGLRCQHSCACSCSQRPWSRRGMVHGVWQRCAGALAAPLWCRCVVGAAQEAVMSRVAFVTG